MVEKMIKRTVSSRELASFCTPPEKGNNGVPETGEGKGCFGISCVSSSLPVATLLEIGDQEGFSAMELLETQLDALNIQQRNKVMEYFPLITGGGLVSPSFASTLLHCDKKMMEDFVCNVEKVFQKFSLWNVKKVTFDLPLDEMLERGDREEEENLLLLLKKLYPVLVRLNMYILLPCRIRSSFTGKLREKVSNFLRRCMSPSVKLHLQFYPHELDKNTDLASLCAYLGFDTKNVTISYNADKGETLVKGHLYPILEYLCHYSYRGSILLSPLSRDDSFAMNEASKYAAFLKEISKNSPLNQKETL